MTTEFSSIDYNVYVMNAEKAGALRARLEINLENTGPIDSDDLLDDPEDVVDMVYLVTGYKLDPEDDTVQEFVDAYISGYEDEWEAYLG